MKTRWMALLAALCLLLGSVAVADWTAPDANLSQYEEQYGQAAESYRRIRYNDSSEQVAAIKQTLAGLGYFPYRVSNNYYRTLQTAIRVFAGQMRIGGDGSEITPLMQAMLANPSALPQAISPVIDVYEYGWEPNSSTYTAYTYARVTRTSVQQSTKVGFEGRIQSAQQSGGIWYYTVIMENDPEKMIYVSYSPLPRTTVFQAGDSIAVFGVTQGMQSLPYTGMSASLLLVAADRVGYAAN